MGENKTMNFIKSFNIIANLWKSRDLIRQITVRDIMARYKGTYLGILWSIILPLFMLSIYTFVFSVVFKAKWGISVSESRTEFALTMFCGMIPYMLFSECLNKATSLITSNQNYVKKVVFPLEILPVTVLLSSIIHTLISLAILFIGAFLFIGTTTWTIIFLPVIFLPLIAMILGFSWFLASLGVFVRDIGYSVGVITQILFFLSPIFYPTSAVPEKFQLLMLFNPLTVIIESLRAVVIWGTMPDWKGILIVTVFSFFILFTGYFWFIRTKKAFADVI